MNSNFNNSSRDNLVMGFGDVLNYPNFSISPIVFYAVEDRKPRVYPWMNKPGGGKYHHGIYKNSSQRILSSVPCNLGM